MAELKTRPTRESVTAFLKRATGGEQRKDCATLARLMKKATGDDRGTVLSTNIVGFGVRQVVYASGRTLDWPIIAFAPRKQHVTLYVSKSDEVKTLLSKLGTHKMSGGCLHLKRLSDVDPVVLERLIAASVKRARKSHT